MIRPELRALLTRWSEPLVALLFGLLGLWLVWLGGWFFGALGLLTGVTALIWLIGALRRLRFRHDVIAPGVVEVDEGAIRYYGARMLGGQIALRDLTEIRLLKLSGRAHWRLKASDGQALLVPLEAAGAESLADAFAALPGVEMGRISSALRQGRDGGPVFQTLWTRPGRADLT